MNNYLDDEKLREFEKNIGWEIIVERNKQIGEFLNFEPRVEYAVCANGACCYSPKNVSSMYSDWRSQKLECDKWLNDNKERFPDGWVAKEGYETTKLEYYPSFHRDWNSLVEAIRRLKLNGKFIDINVDDILSTWDIVYSNCKIVS